MRLVRSAHVPEWRGKDSKRKDIDGIRDLKNMAGKRDGKTAFHRVAWDKVYKVKSDIIIFLLL